MGERPVSVGRDAAATLPRNIVAFNAAISACEKCCRWQQAIALLLQLGAARLSGTTVTYTALLSACLAGQQWAQGLALLKNCQEETVQGNVLTYATLCSLTELAMESGKVELPRMLAAVEGKALETTRKT